jgi:xanthine/uracil permease
VDFRDPTNLMTAAVAITIGAANYTIHAGNYEFNGIALGSIGAIVIYRLLRGLSAAGSRPDPEAAAG